MSRDIEFTYSPTEHHLRRLQLKQSKSQLSHLAPGIQFTTKNSEFEEENKSRLVKAAQQAKIKLLHSHLFIQVM